jgi:hypothetical protein
MDISLVAFDLSTGILSIDINDAKQVAILEKVVAVQVAKKADAEIANRRYILSLYKPRA